MASLIEYLAAHGYWVLFAAVFVEQLGIPLPATPILLGMGALAAGGKLSLVTCLMLAMAACLGADSVWYWLGRRKGQSVLKVLCRISLEPDTCVTVANGWFHRLGDTTLVVAKFVPAFSPVASAMAGTKGMALRRFLVLDLVGATAWTGAFLGLGFLFHNQLGMVVERLERFGSLALVLVGVLLVGYVAGKWVKRRRFLRRLRGARISPEALLARLDSGARVTVLDLRNAEEMAAGQTKIPGAIHFPFRELEAQHHTVPRAGEIVLYCSCPNEETSVAVALALEKRGVRNIQLLEGGYEGWTARGYGVEPV